MHPLIVLVNILAAIASFVIALRLLTYRRGKSRHRKGISMVAWFLINLTLIYAAWLIYSGYSQPFAATINLLALVRLALYTCRVRGNIAHLMTFKEYRP